jgi:transcriptional regulator with XRE-family HTH domain
MRDIVGDVAEEKPKRQRTIPIWDARLSWWIDELESHRQGKGWQAQMSRDTGIAQPDITKILKRKKLTFDDAIKISDYLGIPYPAFLPESKEEALLLMNARRTAQDARRDAQRIAFLERELASAHRNIETAKLAPARPRRKIG